VRNDTDAFKFPPPRKLEADVALAIGLNRWRLRQVRQAGCQAVRAFENFAEREWPINLYGGEIFGRPAYKRIADIGEAPDLVILAVPSHASIHAFIEAADVSSGGAIIGSGDFVEASESGVARSKSTRYASRMRR
jgi:acyl-CoA synthetase (NDP forming)